MSIQLIRQDHEHPHIDELRSMKRSLEDLLRQEPDRNNGDWREAVKEVIRFQYEDGSFNLLDSYHIESDPRVEFCHEPTYICSAILMKALLEDGTILEGNEDAVLGASLHMCCARKLKGHGSDDLKGRIVAVNYFILGNAKDFLKKYPNICREFTDMFFAIGEMFAERVKTCRFRGDWGEDYERSIRLIADYFRDTNVFVYGTLMREQANHDAYLEGNECLGSATLDGYDMYDLGYFPGIVPGRGRVYGEVYRVSAGQLKALDRLEGEGSLYVRKRVNVCLNGEDTEADVYVYNGDVSGCKKTEGRYGSEYVWYVSYGSNLLEERLKYYIRGGECCYNGKSYYPCVDTAMPVESRPVIIPYDMFFSNYEMGSWKDSAVSFLDLSKPGMAYGRAWKIRKDQLDDIHQKEGPEDNWYPECIRLDDIDGFPAYTFAGHAKKTKESFFRVSPEYGIVLYKGMKESYPEMTDEEILDYLRKCGE